MADVKSGNETTEYTAAQSGSIWGAVATILGMLLSFGSIIAEALGTDTKWGVVAGAVLAAAGIAQKTLVQLGYIKSRTDVKVAASQEVTNVDGPELN